MLSLDEPYDFRAFLLIPSPNHFIPSLDKHFHLPKNMFNFPLLALKGIYDDWNLSFLPGGFNTN